MSVQRLNSELRTLQHSHNIDADDIVLLRSASGKKVSKAERALVDEFVRERSSELSSEAVLALVKHFELAIPEAAQLSVDDKSKVDLKEASGIAALDDQNLLVIDDEKGLYLQRIGEDDAQPLLTAKDHPELAGLEGLCLSHNRDTAYLLSEDTGLVFSVPLKNNEGQIQPGAPQELGRVPDLGDLANKGWEGLEFLPGHLSSDGEDKLIAVHEGSPRRIGIFSLPDLEDVKLLPLPKALASRMLDLSDIAVCPKTGNLFVLSDRSATIAELQLSTQHTAGPGALLENQNLRVLGTYKLPHNKHGKPEGLSFGDENTLWVVSEQNKRLLKLNVQRQ